MLFRSYVQDGLGRHKGYEYARTQNPTRAAFEANIAGLEQGKAAFGFASGMAATAAVCRLLKSGDHVVVTDNTYGGTYRLFERVLRNYGLDFTYVDTSDLNALRAAFRPNTRMLFLETPTNPVLRLTDIAAASTLAHEHDVFVVVDNTFASPYVQRPLELGADLVVHSTTKFLNGHSDSVGGVVVAHRDDHIEWLRFIQNAEGAIIGPMDAWLVLRGTKTLAVRMQAHCRGARQVAEFLDAHPKVARVHYPGLTSHPGHGIAARQMTDFGGMVSFEVASRDEAIRIVEATRVFFLAESLGGVESLIEVPAPMTHASVAGSPLEVPETLIRLSVGIEHPDDLVADLARALG